MVNNRYKIHLELSATIHEVIYVITLIPSSASPEKQELNLLSGFPAMVFFAHFLIECLMMFTLYLIKLLSNKSRIANTSTNFCAVNF